MSNALEIRAGNDEEIEIKLTRRNPDTGFDEDVDITGYTFFFTVKQTNAVSTDVNDDDAVVKVTWTNHADAEHGITVLLIPHADTTSVEAGDYWFGIKYKTADNMIKDLELATDVVHVKRQVANRTS